MRHLTDNMYANKDIKKAPYNKISGFGIQAAQSEQQANELFELLSRTNAPAARYLQNIPADEWILYAVDKAGYKLYGHNTSNRVESQNGTFLGARNEGPLRFLDKTLHKQMEWVGERRKEAQKLVEKKKALTSHATEKYAAQKHLSDFCEVSQSSGSIYYVTYQNAILRKRREVDLHNKTCTCLMWQQCDLPCCHAIAAAREARLLSE